MVLHRATCTQVWQYTDMVRPGAFTERESIKVCGLGLDTMRAWAKLHGRPDGTFSKICGICQPAPTPLGTGVVR